MTAELAERIGEFDAILIRSATKLTPELIERADRMKVIGRAGTGVDNVDIPAATKRGIIVANAPESNSVAAAEHTLALALALFRNVPQAHGSLVAGRWDRGLYKGSELYGKTLGVIGFGRIGQLVAKRAQAFEMEVLAFDKFVSAERFRDLGVEGVGTVEELYERADLLTIHLPKTPETVNWIDADAIAAMKPGMRIVNCARGELIDLDALIAGLDSGQVKGAALDVFPEEPFTEHPIFSRDDVVVTPHLGASTSEAQDRAGTDTAEQVTAALTGGVVTNAVNIAVGQSGRDGGTGAVRPAVPDPRSGGRRADPRRDRPGRGRLPRRRRGLRHQAAGGRRPGRPALRPHRRGGQPGQRAADGRRTWHRGQRQQGTRRRGLHRPDPGIDHLARRDRVGRRHHRRTEERCLTWSRSGTRASTCLSPTTWPSSATRTSRA